MHCVSSIGEEDVRSEKYDHDLSENHQDSEYVSRDIEKPTIRDQVAILVCGFIATFQTLGLSQAFGVLQLYHSKNIGTKNRIISDSDAKHRAGVSVIGSITTSLIYLLGFLIVGALRPSDRKTRWNNVSVLVALGSAIVFTGYLGASFSTRLWQLVLTQGCMVGMGYCLYCNPIMSIAPEYFSQKNQGKAMGVVTAGSGIGGLVYSPLTSYLVEKCGMRSTLRIFGVSGLLIGLLVAAFIPPPRTLLKPRKTVPKALLTDSRFHIVVVSNILFGIAINLPVSYGPQFSAAIGMSAENAALTLAVLNGVGSLFRLVWGWARDKIGSQNSYILSSLLPGLAISIMWLISAEKGTQGLWWAFVVMFGVTGGGSGVVIAPFLIDVFGNEVFFSLMALLNVFRGAACLVGAPLGGAMLGNENAKITGPRFEKLVVFVGTMVLVSAGLNVVSRSMQARKDGWKWLA